METKYTIARFLFKDRMTREAFLDKVYECLSKDKFIDIYTLNHIYYDLTLVNLSLDPDRNEDDKKFVNKYYSSLNTRYYIKDFKYKVISADTLLGIDRNKDIEVYYMTNIMCCHELCLTSEIFSDFEEE